MRKAFRKNYLKFTLAFLIIIAGTFLFYHKVYALEALNFILHPINTTVMGVVGTLGQITISVVGAVLTIVVWAVIHIAQYNNFINEPSIVSGWIIIRDLCNMLFILVLLVIAFTTILRIESYSAKKLLPKLLIMAVLINFSRTICGLIIDAAQVVMLTFINAIGESGGNFINTLGVQKYLDTKVWGPEWGKDLNLTSTVMGIILGVMFLVIAAIVLIVFLAVLTMRIVMLWIYVVLSPLAFLLSSFPQGQKYSSQWWGDFIQNVVSGPVLAFFLWLSLVSAGKITDIGSGGVGAQGCFGPLKILCPADFANFVVAIGMLIGGLVIAQKAGGAAGSFAGKGLGWAKKAPKIMGLGALGAAGWGARKLKARTGLELRPTKIIAGFRESLKAKKEREELMGESKAGAALKEGKLWGALGASRDFADAAATGLFWHRGWKGKSSVIHQTRMKGKTQKRMKQIQKQLDNKDIKQEDRDKLQTEFDAKQKEWATYKAPETFYADSKRNTMVREKMKNFYDNDNAEDLHTIMMNAMDSGQADVALGAFLQMAKVGHDNEALNMTKALEDYKDEKGNVVIGKGEYLTCGADGMKAFAKQYLMNKDKLGLSEEEAYSMIMQVSTMAKNTRHHNLAEMIGVENGNKFIRSSKDQRARAAGEFRKLDPEQNMRQGNRLAHMDEIQFKYDAGTDGYSKQAEAAGEVDRVAVVTDLTESNFVNQLSAWERELNAQKRFNPNLAENLFKNYLMVTKHGDLFNADQKRTLVNLGKAANVSFKDSKGNDTTTERVAWQTLDRGRQVYEGHFMAEKAPDEAKVNMGQITKEEFDKKWGTRQAEFNEIKTMIEQGLKSVGASTGGEETKKSKRKPPIVTDRKRPGGQPPSETVSAEDVIASGA